VTSVDPRITVISIDPDVQTVELDDITTLDIPVEVDQGTPPAGLEIGASSVEPTTVKVTGPASIVRNVVKALARVVIQPNGLSIDQDVPLTAVDQLGNPVTPVKVEPDTAHVKIQVLSDSTQKTVPVKPNITGTPAGGFEVGTVTLSPPTVTVVGNADQLANLTKIDTEPIPVTGLSSKDERDVLLVMPDGVAPLDEDTVHVVIDLRPVTATRSFDVGLRLINPDPDLSYKLGSDRVLVVLGGSTADLDRLVGSTLVADLDVTDLGVGTTSVKVTAAPREGVTLVSASPAEVTVTVTPRASPPPSVAPSGAVPSASPGG
jgi:YbbR domain-containing protein